MQKLVSQAQCDTREDFMLTKNVRHYKNDQYKLLLQGMMIQNSGDLF